MLNAYEAVIENGQLNWLDAVPNLENQRVKVIILPDVPSHSPFYDLNKDGEKRWGFMQGEMRVPDDINAYDDEVAKLFGVE